MYRATTVAAVTLPPVVVVVLDAHWSAWVLVGWLGCVAVVGGVARFRVEARKLDRILLEELGPVEDRVAQPVESTRMAAELPHAQPDFSPGSYLRPAS